MINKAILQIEERSSSIVTLRPDEAVTRQSMGSLLFQVIAYRLLSEEASPEIITDVLQIEPSRTNFS